MVDQGERVQKKKTTNERNIFRKTICSLHIDLELRKVDIWKHLSVVFLGANMGGGAPVETPVSTTARRILAQIITASSPAQHKYHFYSNINMSFKG